MGCDYCSCSHYLAYSGKFIASRIKNLTRFSGIMVIGESPTAVECKNSQMLTGKGAMVLKETMAKLGLPTMPDEVYYTTAVKCSVPKKKGQKFPSEACRNCREFLLNEIQMVNPTHIIVCGAVALQTLTGRDKLKVTELYGRNIMDSGVFPESLCENEPIIVPVMNPGVLIHKPGEYKPFLQYMTLFANLYKQVEVKHTDEVIYEVLDTHEKCRAVWCEMDTLHKAGKLPRMGVDIETTGLDYREAEVLVIGFNFGDKSYVIPRCMLHEAHNFIQSGLWDNIWHHGKFDKKITHYRGIGEIPIDEDTIYMHCVLDETSAHDLGYLTKIYLNAEEYKFKMNQNWKVVTLDTYDQFFDALCERVAVDAAYTFQLWEVLNDELSKPANECLMRVYRELMIPGANFLNRVEFNGCKIFPPYLRELDVKYQALLEEKMRTIVRLAEPDWDPKAYQVATGAKSLPTKFNPASPKQISWLVFDKLKLKPRIRKGKSTSKEILGSIESPPPLIQEILSYRTTQKEHATYVLGLLEAMHTDGRVHPNFTLHITATGRLSCKEPNVQNQPSANGIGNVRKAFVARPGYILAEIDYSGAELRWLGFLSKCPELCAVFKEGRNLHKEVATALFGPGFTVQQKMMAKAVTFGIMYGREAKSIADTFAITLPEAQKMIDDWLDTYPGARGYLNWCADQVTKGNYLETPWGRRRRFGLVTEEALHGLQNEAKNFPIQSSSSDTLLYTCIQEEQWLKEHGTTVINLIHDSALLEIPADPLTIAKVADHMDVAMRQTPIDLFDCDIPFLTDFEIGVNWGDLGGTTFDYHSDDLFGKIVEVEGKDKTTEAYTFRDWYEIATEPYKGTEYYK